jgi:hypothetical protein
MPRPVRHRGHIERRSETSYRVIVYAGLDPLTGEERRIRETVRSEDEAKVTLTKLLR